MQISTLKIASSLLIAAALVSGIDAACRNIEHFGTCGVYSETGQISCYFQNGEEVVICATHPQAIVYPATINRCVDADVGEHSCDNSGEQVEAIRKTYDCNGCDIVEADEEVIQRCVSATLSGGQCPTP